MDITPTRAAVVELQDERRSMRDGYMFLDEKRLLLAAQMLKELRVLEDAWRAFDERRREAAEALRAAVARHGLDGVQVYPAARLEKAGVEVTAHRLLGVRLLEARLVIEPGVAPPPVCASVEAERCRRLFLDLLSEAAALAARASNLERLRHEYRRTERRARALEDVLLPEIEQTLGELDARLEEVEQEDAVRVRTL
jgi:V/A-type H+-transporting ATPase subunit D